MPADPSDSSIDASLVATSDEAINALPLSVACVVSLATPFSETGPFRALVEKFFISPSHRRLRLGRRLMVKLEQVALSQGRTNVLLDTTVGTPTEKNVSTSRIQEDGVTERYGIHPLDGLSVDEVWFWKDLNADPILREPEV